MNLRFSFTGVSKIRKKSCLEFFCTILVALSLTCLKPELTLANPPIQISTTGSTSVEKFIAFIQETNPEVKALAEIAKTKKQLQDQADQVWSPSLFGELSQMKDQKQQSFSQFNYDELLGTQYKLGIQNQFKMGLSSKLYFQGNRSEVKGGSFGSGSFDATTWDHSPVIELQYPLLSGSGASKTKSIESLSRLKSQVDLIQAEANLDQKILEVKLAYWAAVIQKELILIQRESVKQVASIYRFVKQKAEKNLEQSSNVIQTQSALETLEVELASSEQSLLLILQQLQDYAPQVSDQDVPRYPLERIANFVNDQKPKSFTGHQILERLNLRTSVVQADQEIDESKAQLDLFGQHSFNAVEDTMGKSVSALSKMKHPSTLIGIRFTLPLNVSYRERNARNQKALSQATMERIRHHSNTSRNKLETLQKQIQNSVKLFKLNVNLEKTQAARLDNERKLLRQGRSSIYQILQFEIEYSRARAAKWNSVKEFEMRKAELELYKYDQELFEEVK